MPDQTTILSLPHILPAQAQKHVTHNEALRLLDVMVQLAVADRDRGAPPTSPVLGARHIVATPASGAWAGQAGKVALWNGSAWEFFTPLEGWRAWVMAEAALAVYDGTGWTIAGSGPAEFEQLGVGMAADATNRLAVESAAALFTNPTGSHRLALNKGAAAQTASLLIQDGYSTRAEIGALANDHLTVKVSPDGTAFIQTIVVDKDSGKVTVETPLRLLPMAGEPATLGDGELWYDSSMGKFRGRQAGVSVDLIGAGAGGSTFSDSDFRLVDNLDATKKAAFQLAALTGGTTRTYDLPDISGEIALLGGTQTFTGDKSFSGATLDFGTSTGGTTVGVGTGVTTAGQSKTVNLGTAGVSGSTTTVNIGSAVGGALGTTAINSPTLNVAASSVFMGNANAAIAELGVGGASADATNRLSVSAPGVLFNHAGAGMEATINKSAAGNWGFLSFKTAFSGRAQLGLIGDNNLSLRVSADGSAFNDVFTADGASGSLTLGKPAILTGQAADPAAPADGTVWFNSTSGQFKVRAGGETRVFDSPRDVPSLVPASGEHVLTTMGAGTTTGTLAGAANRIAIFPFVARSDLAVTGLAINCTTAVASALAKIVIYASDANGRPDALILETGTLDLSSIGVKTATVSLSLLSGRSYWLGIRSSSTATVSTWAANATPDINGGSPVTSARKTLQRTLTFATAASATWGFTSSEISSNAAAAIWLRL